MSRTQESVAAIGLLATVLVACGASLNAVDRAELAGDGIRIGTCEAIASQCGDDMKRAGKSKAEAGRACWPVFDACRDDAGITPEGGKR